jgi:formimidoylglutamate deiminase
MNPERDIRMSNYRIDCLLSATGWMRDAVVTVSEQGLITGLSAGLNAGAHAADATHIRGTVVPGMPNAHSHAFQRAMAGDSELRSGARDSFWSWREAMYALANGVEPEDLELIATQLFIEMLKAGYTSVAEFHYLHRRADGSAYPDANALWQAIDAAAGTAGIALTLLPTLYLSSDFGARPLRREQQRFRLSVEEFLQAIARRRSGLAQQDGALVHTGAALHSLRAVPLDCLREAVAGLRAIDPAGVIHIHIAEQLLEVHACQSETGRRPIELLLDTGLVGPQWCLVHATHATASEIAAVAASEASVCVCPSTEGNLGDGFFDAARLLGAGAGLCIGSDSQATVCPAEELRWLEYQQRLKRRRRAVLATRAEPHVGARLWREATRCGARALGQNIGTIQIGRRADWLVLDAAHPALAGADEDGLLDRLVFSGGQAAVRDVMVAGRWVVKDGQHRREEEVAARFATWMRQRPSRTY